ncbi:MAG: response regulator [Burkholderiales bacterium]|jgi:DNA-binding NarL/FixJ family response regulator|nr:response regulator transcription factor [Burkholderiales bacterium]MCA3153499.1 response regulator transcription factor [Burkholderiales bacterium]MCA3167539.1 response regulator transcription factor [Burkholderiales bacterium]
MSLQFRLMIVDDHALLRMGIAKIFDDTADLKVVAEGDSYSDILRAANSPGFDLLLLDLDMPGRGGIDILKLFKKDHPRIPVLILSMYPEDQYAVRALKAGAAGYVNKAFPPERMLLAVRTVLNGKKYISPEIAMALADGLTQDDTPAHEKLSDREFQTLQLIASGLRLSEIAEALSLSPKTVSVYRARILEKMRLSSNAEITHYALKNGLVK